MKNVKNQLIFVLTSALLATGLTVGASAQTIVVGTPGTGNCTSWNAILSKTGSSDCPSVSDSSDCPSDSGLKSLLGELYSICPSGQVSDNTTVYTGTDAAEASQSCLNTAEQAATCNNTNKQSASASQSAADSSSYPTTAAAQKSNSAVSAAEKAASSGKAATVSQTAEKQTAAAQTTTAAQATAQETAAAEPDSAVQDSTAPVTTSAATSASCTAADPETAFDVSTSQVSGNTLMQYINTLLKKCGIDLNALGINLPDCGAATASSPASGGTDNASQQTDTTDQTSAAPAGNTGTGTSDQNAATPSGSSQSTQDTSSSGQSGTGSDSQKADNPSFEEQVVALVNEQRAANGLQPLTLSSALSNAARAKSQDMHDNHYFAHESPTYGSPFEMLTSFGISYRAAGENIAMGYATPEAVMNAWMNSSGHRANILNASYTQIGVGYVADGNYWTQEFTS